MAAIGSHRMSEPSTLLITCDSYGLAVNGSTKQTQYKAQFVIKLVDPLSGLTLEAAEGEIAPVLASEEYLAKQAKAVEALANTPKKLQIGQTEEEVIAILGQPQTIIGMGNKEPLTLPTIRD